MFLGWGEPSHEEPAGADDETDRETDRQQDRTPVVMLATSVVLLVGTIGFGVWFGFADLAATAARRFISGTAYQAIVFGHPPAAIHATSSAPEWYDWIYSTGATTLALAFAAIGLWGRRLGVGRLVRAGHRVMSPVRRLHTGRIGDYTAALTLGVGLLGGLLAVTLR